MCTPSAIPRRFALVREHMENPTSMPCDAAFVNLIINSEYLSDDFFRCLKMRARMVNAYMKSSCWILTEDVKLPSRMLKSYYCCRVLIRFVEYGATAPIRSDATALVVNAISSGQDLPARSISSVYDFGHFVTPSLLEGNLSAPTRTKGHVEWVRDIISFTLS